MLPTVSIGPLVLPTAGLVYILGIWLALTAVEQAATRLNEHVAATYTLATVALASAFVAARLAFVIQHWGAYRQNLLGIVWPLTSGYNLGVGFLVGIAAAFFYGRARRLSAGETLDALTPGLLVGLMAISTADFLAGPGYGAQADLPWSVTLFGIRRHPVQLYELLAGLLALAVWVTLLSRRRFAGQLFLSSGALYSAGRLFVEAFRANPWLTPGGYRVVQIISLAGLLACLLLLLYRSEPRPERSAEQG